MNKILTWPEIFRAFKTLYYRRDWHSPIEKEFMTACMGIFNPLDIDYLSRISTMPPLEQESIQEHLTDLIRSIFAKRFLVFLRASK